MKRNQKNQSTTHHIRKTNQNHNTVTGNQGIIFTHRVDNNNEKIENKPDTVVQRCVPCTVGD